ncbi:MAG: restriction endonuclease subunit S [Ruminococcus sp.]|nr:restriction endonuclease subunit S [Ruminococcus sp.]
MKCIEDEIPFELPEGWEWTRLGVIFSHNTGKALNSKNQFGKLYTYITTSNLYWNKFELNDVRQMTFNELELEKCTVKKGDLLICEGGDIGRFAIWDKDEEIRIQNHIHRLRPYVNLCVKFYYYVMYLYKQTDRINGKGIGIQGLSSNQLHSLYVPLPPLDEQSRIIMQVDDYFQYIDDIETSKNDLSNVIYQTKSKILDLAIRGKLVEQDQNDEPASVLLERIRAEKEELIKQGKIKRDKNESVIFKDEDNSYYDVISNLPQTWEIATFSELNFFQSINIDPMKFTNDKFVLYSVPQFECESPEILNGKDIGSTKQVVHNDDVLLCKINPRLNRVWIVREKTQFKMIASSEWIVFRNKWLYSPYLCYYLTSPFFRNILLTNVSGVGGSLMRARPESVKKYSIFIPPLSEQKRIADKIRQLFSFLDAIAEALE